MKTKIEELADSKIRLEVEVPEAAVDHAFEHAARDLAEGMRVPGFRKGKVPYAVVAARVGMEALSEEAVRSHVEGWFWDAAVTAGVRPVGGPEVDWQLPPERGKAFTFVATVPVAPPPQLADWRTLEVPAGETEVPADVIDAELDRLRESQAELMPVSGRPVAPGDTVVLDLVAVEEDKEPAEHRDYVAELGAGRLAGEIEDALLDMSEGDTKVVEIDLLEEGKGTVTVTLNEIKQKRLPELDDELARAATEFETLAELRADVERRLRDQLDAALEARFREAALDALVDASGVEGIEPLVERRTGALLAGLVRSLEQRGVSAEAYLAATGQTPETLEQSARAESERAVKRELVLEAAADRLAVEITDEEIEELIRREAAESGDDVDAAVDVLRERGGFEQIRGDLRLRKALDTVAAEVKRIPVELAAAREKLWTPEKEKGGSGMKIWTPGTEEPK